MQQEVEVGFKAGKIYQALDQSEGKSLKLSELKKKVDAENTEYALGWLLREGKITIIGENKKQVVSLI